MQSSQFYLVDKEQIIAKGTFPATAASHQALHGVEQRVAFIVKQPEEMQVFVTEVCNVCINYVL